MDYVDLGARIRQRRIQKGWTQEALAKEIGMSTSFMGHIERGSRKASLETLVQIANAMSVSLDELLDGSLTWKEKQHEKELNELLPGQRQVMNEVLRLIQENLDKGGEEDPES